MVTGNEGFKHRVQFPVGLVTGFLDGFLFRPAKLQFQVFDDVLEVHDAGLAVEASFENVLCVLREAVFQVLIGTREGLVHQFSVKEHPFGRDRLVFLTERLVDDDGFRAEPLGGPDGGLEGPVTGHLDEWCVEALSGDEHLVIACIAVIAFLFHSGDGYVVSQGQNPKSEPSPG